MMFIVVLVSIAMLVFGALMISRAIFSDESNERECKDEEKTPCTLDDYTYRFNAKN